MPVNPKTPCQRCGKCCQEVGRTFWKYDEEAFDDIAELQSRATDGDWDDEGKCEMLVKVKDKQLCQIEIKYGRQAKPQACKEYPQQASLCFFKSNEHVKAMADQRSPAGSI